MNHIRVLCIRNTFYHNFVIGKWYNAKMFVPDSYWVYDIECEVIGTRFYFDRELGGYIFSDYFMTEKELRKKKLKQLET